MHAFTSVLDASSSLLQSVRAAVAASMAEITVTVLRTAAHTARLSNVILFGRQSFCMNFTNILFTNHKLRYLMFLGAFLAPRVQAVGAFPYLLPFNCIFMGLGCNNLL